MIMYKVIGVDRSGNVLELGMHDCHHKDALYKAKEIAVRIGVHIDEYIVTRQRRNVSIKRN